ncbi:MAG: transglutaminase-like domain-containing protein [Thiobacillus sp.]
MERRDFLRLAAMTPLLAAAPRALAMAGGNAADWRTFELTYAVDFSQHKGTGRLWLPLPQNAGDYQRVLAVGWKGETDAALQWDDTYQAPILTAAWEGGDDKRTLTVTAQVAARNRPLGTASPRLRDMDAAALYLKPTEHMPVDGIVAATAQRIVHGVKTPDARARAIYEWVVDNTFRNPQTRGCGLGNIKFMLESGDLGGKCADINSLFVGLCRAAAIPAREFYGVRVADSAQFKCLGKSGDVSRAQHCRAEYFSPRFGWVAVDPADVRKVVLEEKLALDDPRVVALRQRLFGYWEMNWVGFNTARDFTLPGKAGEPLSYLMYPYAEFGETRLDGRDPVDFTFRLSSRQLA